MCGATSSRWARVGRNWRRGRWAGCVAFERSTGPIASGCVIGLGSAKFRKHDAVLRQMMETMRSTAVEELSTPKLREPCRRALESLQEHWPGLTRFLDDPRIPLDNNASERAVRGPALGEKELLRFGRLVVGPSGGDDVFAACHAEALETQSAEVAHRVFRELCSGWRQGPWRHSTIPALEYAPRNNAADFRP